MVIGERPASTDFNFMKLSALEPNTDPRVNKNRHLLMVR